MKELQRTDRLLISTGIFILVLIIGILTMREPDLKYARNLTESAQDSQNPEAVITPEEVAALLASENENVLFADLRNIYDYDRGHLRDAIHIPVTDLLDKEITKLFDRCLAENRTVILYGKDQLGVAGPAMLLRDLGYDNVKAMMGGYYYINNLEVYPEGIPAYLTEAPKYDFSDMKSSTTPSGLEDSTPAVPEVVVPVKKNKAKAEGGC